MASKVKVEPPDEGDAAFGMNGNSLFLHGHTVRSEESADDPFMGMIGLEEIKNEDDPFGLAALLRAHEEKYNREYEDENRMEYEEEYGRNGDLVHDPFDDVMGLNDGEEMRRRKEAETNATEPLETTPLLADNHSVQRNHVYTHVNSRLPRGNFVPNNCAIFGTASNEAACAPNDEPPTDNVPEKEQPQTSLYDNIKQKTRRQSMRVIEAKKVDAVVEKKKGGRKSTAAKKVAGARKSTPRNVIGVVTPAKRGRPKGSKTKPKEVSNPPDVSPMDEGDTSMGNGIIDPALVRRRPRMAGGSGKAAAAAANSCELQSSLLPWKGSVHSTSHSFDNSTIDRSHPTTVSRSMPNFHQWVGRPYMEGHTSTTISQWGVHSTTVSPSTPNVSFPIADHTYTGWRHPLAPNKPATGKASTRKAVRPLIPPAAHMGQPKIAMVRLKPTNPPINIPNRSANGGVRVVDPRRARERGEEDMKRMNENAMETSMTFYDPRRVQRKSIDCDFAPHPIDEGDMFRVVCGPIPEKEVSLDVIRERVLSLCRPFDYKFTRFEGNYYMWLRFAVEQEAYNLVQSRPFRLGIFSAAFNRPGTVTVDTNGPMGDYYLFTVLTKYGNVTGVEKIGEFKWKATFLEEIEAMSVVNQKLERIGQNTLTYSPYTPTPRVEIDSPASPPYQFEEDAAPASPTPIIVPTHPAAPIRHSRPIHIPTHDYYAYDVDDDQLAAGTDAQTFSATTMADTPASPTGADSGTSMVRAPARTKTQQHYTGALVPRTAGTIAAQPHHHSGYRVQPYEGRHMAHMVAGAPGGARGAVVPVGGQGRGMVMVRSTMETAIERMKKMGEGLAVFPLAHGDDVKECVVGMRSWTNHIVLGPMPFVYNEDQMRRAYQIHPEIGLRMIGCFMHLFIAEEASQEVKLHLWRIQNCTEGVMTSIAKGVPRSIIVKGTSLYCTADSVKDYFESQYGRVVSVNEEHERMVKIFAVNFMHRKEAASAYNTQIHFALVDGEPFVLCEVVRN